MLKVTERAKGIKGQFTGYTKMEHPVNDAPTLPELGLNYKTASLAQKLTDLPDVSNVENPYTGRSCL